MQFYKFPFEKYKFHVFQTKDPSGAEVTKVVATSTYAKRVVRGVAICSKHDEFDIEKGKKLAAARCNAKVALLRYKNSSKRLDEATELVSFVEKHRSHMVKYNIDAYEAMQEANSDLRTLEESLM